MERVKRAQLSYETQSILKERARDDLPAATCFLLVFAIALAVRVHGVSAKPFWMDEVTTLQRAGLPFGEMLRQSLFFHQLPAFFVVTSWALPFGHDEFFVRLPAMLFGALSCALGFAVARALGGTACGLAAGALLGFSPAMVQYGQEARSYTMMISAILLALWGLAVLARAPARAAARWREGGLPWAWAAYTLGTAAALNVLSDALFWFVAANLAAIAIGRHPAARGGTFWRHWLVSQAVILALSAPWFVAIKFLGQRGVMGGLDWVQPLTWARLWWALASTYFFQVTSLITVRIFPPSVSGFGFLVVAMAVAGLVRLRRRGAALPVMAAAILVLPVCLIGISLVTPVLMPRYLLWSGAPFCVCAGLALGWLPQNRRTTAAAAVTLLAAINLPPYYHDETKPRWDLAGAAVAQVMRPGDLLLTNDAQAVSLMDLYLTRRTPPMAVNDWTESLATAQAARAAGRRVWVVQGKVGQADHETQAAFLRRIAPLGPPDVVQPIGLDILLLCYGAASGRQS
jgi:4-amino-4-deoxy-L-arabinose transferase-like glycosyltransferase